LATKIVLIPCLDPKYIWSLEQIPLFHKIYLCRFFSKNWVLVIKLQYF
jgi:hypothetical protein